MNIDMNQRANKVCKILNGLADNEFIKAPALRERLLSDYGINLTPGQLQGVITYIKDCSRFVDYSSYINWFVVSTRDGYALLRKVDSYQIGRCYKKLFLSSKAEELRVKPILKYLKSIDFDFDSIDLNEDDFSEFEIERMKEFSNLFNKED